jgi:two-component system sensor histidine kinase DctS
MPRHLPPLPKTASSHDSKRMHWRLLMPKMAVLLLLLALASLLWIVHRNEIDEQRQQLIADILWIEQNFRFELNNNEEQLKQLAVTLAHEQKPLAAFEVNSRHLLNNSPAFEQILWLDARGSVRHGLPSAIDQQRQQNILDSGIFRERFELAQKLSTPAYTPPHLVPMASARFEILVPIYQEKTFVGMLVGVYAVDSLFNHLVPWWFAQKYQLRMIDDNGIVLGAKSNVASSESSEAALNYQIPLDPPGGGVQLQSTAYRDGGNPAQRILAAVIVALAGVVLWSLWSLRQHIHRRLAVEQALRDEHAFRKAIEDSMIVGLRARDLDGRITYVNAAFCQMVGFSAEELTGHLPPMPYWDPEHLDIHETQSAQVLAGASPSHGFESRLRHKKGRIVHTRVYATPLIDADGKHSGWISSVLDITEQKRIEELQRQQQMQLEQTARLVTMGEMASTLAHELNQPLSAIASYNTGCLNLLKAAMIESPDPALDGRRLALIAALEKLGQQSQRAGRIIRRVHDFVRKSEPRRALCRIEEVIEDSIGFIEAEAEKYGARIESHLDPRLPDLSADRQMLEQVMLNLLKNGIEAMADTLPPLRLLVVNARVVGDQIEVSVADRGKGFAPGVAEQLFTPFFTTKPEGMGMGLAICRSIIEFHHGRLWAEDDPGGGGLFIFTLPINAN